MSRGRGQRVLGHGVIVAPDRSVHAERRDVELPGAAGASRVGALVEIEVIHDEFVSGSGGGDFLRQPVELFGGKAASPVGPGLVVVVGTVVEIRLERDDEQ